jgi:hypothetical protein
MGERPGCEELVVDAVRHHVHLGGQLARQAGPQLLLATRDQRGARAGGENALFIGAQAPRLERVERPQRQRRAFRVLTPLVRIDVAEIHDEWQVDAVQVRRHRRREEQHRIEPLAPHGLLHPLAQPRRLEPSHRKRLRARERREAAQARPPQVERGDLEARRHGAQRRHVHEILRLIGETAEMHAVARREVSQLVERADLVALVGRIRDAVDEEEQVHRASAISAGAIASVAAVATSNGRSGAPELAASSTPARARAAAIPEKLRTVASGSAGKQSRS